MFFKGSRYARVPDAEWVDGAGRTVRYKRTRFIAETAAEGGHRTILGDRLDRVAHRYLDDPERFWRICDGNLALWPDDLLAEPGRIIRIPSAED